MLFRSLCEMDIETTTDKEVAVIAERLKGKRAAIVSPGRLKEVSAMAKRGIQVIEFIYTPDAGSVNLLGASVLEHRKKNRQEEVERGSGVAVGDNR